MEQIRKEYVRGTTQVKQVGDKVREVRLSWFGYVQRRRGGIYWTEGRVANQEERIRGYRGFCDRRRC